MKCKLYLFFLITSLCVTISASAQLLTWSPEFIQENSSPVTITMDATKGNQGLLNHTPTTDVYVHIGVITTLSANSSDWKYSKFTWGTTNPAAQTTNVAANKWQYTINGGLRSFFGITNTSEKILKIAILFRSGNGSKSQRNTDGSDMYIPVYDAGLAVRITNPPTQPKFTPEPEPINVSVGGSVPVTGTSNAAATLRLYLNGNQFASATNATTVSGNAVIAAPGIQKIVVEANNGSVTKFDTIQFTVTGTTVVEPLPTGLKDGINYNTAGTEATLVLVAPGKQNIAVIGEFNNWSPTTAFQMKKTPDGQRFWLNLTGLTPGAEYAYQFLIDGTLKVADYNTEKVLDPNNDQFIPSVNYPNLKPYPTGSTTGIVSVLQPGKQRYNFQHSNYTRPDKRNLLIYELLVRDFVGTKNWQTMKDTLPYLKKLGINTIELMPVNEFEGNNSWGYNPSFFFAPDKMYGTETAFKQFIDECHRNGISVIMDLAMNHAFGQSPTVQMYWNSSLNRPSADNPFHNEAPKHAYNVGYDFNHESQATKDLVHRVARHWLTNYQIDGFRWDLSKGFTQNQTCDANGANCNEGAMAAYDASRIAIWKRIYDTMQAAAPGSYCILEHFAVNSEEIELANYGMLLWGNLNHNYNEATMGYLPNSNFQGGIYTQRGWTAPHLITYQESHDEERLMYKNLSFGNTTNPAHNVRNLATALQRNGMATAFWAMTPAPKMLWQFGELGYDYSINTCEDGTINNNCRLSPKPIRWDYLANSNRKALYDVYSKLLKLRNVPNYLPTWVTSNITHNLSGGFKTLQVSSDSLKITVIGNFDVFPTTGTVAFQDAGVWYNYLGGGTRMSTGSTESITLQPGEYYVYTNKDVTSLVNALPLKLVSFNGRRTPTNFRLSWATTNEVNVRSFVVERAYNGIDFSAVGTVTARNTVGGVQNTYVLNDVEPQAINAKGKVFYRLRMIDIDGKQTVSNIVNIHPLAGKTYVSIYPNPVKNNATIEYEVAQSGNVTISVVDVAGKPIGLLVNGFKPRGIYKIDLSGINPAAMASGTYMLKIVTGGKTTVQQFAIQH